MSIDAISKQHLMTDEYSLYEQETCNPSLLVCPACEAYHRGATGRWVDERFIICPVCDGQGTVTERQFEEYE